MVNSVVACTGFSHPPCHMACPACPCMCTVWPAQASAILHERPCLPALAPPPQTPLSSRLLWSWMAGWRSNATTRSVCGAHRGRPQCCATARRHPSLSTALLWAQDTPQVSCVVGQGYTPGELCGTVLAILCSIVYCSWHETSLLRALLFSLEHGS